MGQSFILFNIDKQKRIRIGKFGEGYIRTSITSRLYTDSKHSWSWVGDRLIVMGCYAEDLPAGVEEEGDTKEMFMYYDDPRRPIFDNRASTDYNNAHILRNLCTREYIRADLFPSGSTVHPELGDALIPKIVWSSDSNLTIPNGLVSERGLWAGGRFDIVEYDVIKGEEGWIDITQVEFFNYYTLWSTDLDMVGTCDCALCEKFRTEKGKFYEDLATKNKGTRSIKARDKGVAQVVTAPVQVHQVSCQRNLSTIEIIPAELQEEILGYLNQGDLASCAVASQTLSFEATRLLYASVKLTSAKQTHNLLGYLNRCPEVSCYIKCLRLVMQAHWKSLQIAHEILKRLPALKALEFAPCWFSYGDLPYWEYPFELRALTWGLRKGAAFDQFCASHPGAQIALTDPTAELLHENEESD